MWLRLVLNISVHFSHSLSHIFFLSLHTMTLSEIRHRLYPSKILSYTIEIFEQASTHRNIAREVRCTQNSLPSLERESRAFFNVAGKHTRNTSATAANLRLTDSRLTTGPLLLQTAGRAQRAMPLRVFPPRDDQVLNCFDCSKQSR